MRNNAYIGETRERRLRRFSDGHPKEIIDTLIESIANFFVNELRSVFDNSKNYQTSLMFLGTHSIALSIAFGLFNKSGEEGYCIFLERFIDGDTADKKFSLVANRIHGWRNVIAHRWLNVAGHSLVYDFSMSEGWRIDGESLMVNPKIYLEQFLKAFGTNGKIYQYYEFLETEEEWEGAKQRFILKYIREA